MPDTDASIDPSWPRVESVTSLIGCRIEDDDVVVAVVVVAVVFDDVIGLGRADEDDDDRVSFGFMIL